MTDDLAPARRELRALLATQYAAVLATQNAGQPYTSLVAFAASDDLRQLIFATARASRKYENLLRDSRVALHIDNRTNEPADIQSALSVTALGRAVELAGAEREASAALYLRKQPHLADFLASPDCALLRVDVETYLLVSQFQRITEIRPMDGSPS